MPHVASKDALRAAASAARALISVEQWAAEDAARTRHALAAVDEMPVGTASVYLSLPGEPGTNELIDGLVARGWKVLVPVLRKSPDWGGFEGWGALVPGWAGIPQPTGPRLGAEAITAADLIFMSALTVGRDGTRLGTGGGWYDRALTHRRPDALVIAVTRAAELTGSVPALPHDVPVDGYVTEHDWVLVDG